MTTTTPTLAEQAAAAQAEANRLRAEADRTHAAGIEARDAAMLEHYRHAATERAREYRERRDALKDNLDDLATADKLDLNQLFAAWIAMRDEDTRCSGLATHASMADSLNPQPRNHNGSYPMPRGAGVNELYTPQNGWTFTAFVDRVLAQRAVRIRAHHIDQLRVEVHKEVSAAEAAARAAAGG